MSNYDQVISSSEILCEGTYFFNNINYLNYDLQNNKSFNIIVSLKTIINVNVNTKCYGLKYLVPPSLRSISHNDSSKLPPQHVSMEENDNIIDEKN